MAVEELLKKKRKRRTKAEMELARQEESQKKTNKKKKKRNIHSWYEGHFMTTEEVCEQKLQEALDNKLEEPYFDFRIDYERGNKIWFVNVNKLSGDMRVDELIIGTVYPRMIAGKLDKGETVMIPYEERDMIFSIPKDADKKLKELKKKH